jgi:hypothetical protein
MSFLFASKNNKESGEKRIRTKTQVKSGQPFLYLWQKRVLHRSNFNLLIDKRVTLGVNLPVDAVIVLTVYQEKENCSNCFCCVCWVHAVHGLRLRRLPMLPVSDPWPAARGGLHRPQHCQHGWAL